MPIVDHYALATILSWCVNRLDESLRGSDRAEILIKIRREQEPRRGSLDWEPHYRIQLTSGRVETCLLTEDTLRRDQSHGDLSSLAFARWILERLPRFQGQAARRAIEAVSAVLDEDEDGV